MRIGPAALIVAVVLGLSAAPAGAVVPWKTCPHGRAQCASVRVPRDYAKPSGPSISIAMARLRAREPKHRLGTLFVNFGGPGAPGVSSIRLFGDELFATLRKRYDIVGFDPRGVGRSRPAVDCHANQEALGVYAQPFTRPRDFKASAVLRRAQRYVNRCVRRNGAILRYLTTGNTARDLDRLRAAVGDPRLNYLGFSYGSFLGATYTSLFPTRLGRIVLDGAVDPDNYVNHPLTDLDHQTGGFELALRRFFATCHAHPRACKHFGGKHPLAAYRRLGHRLDRHPVKPKSGPDRRPVDGDDLRNAVLGDVYSKQAWPDIVSALAGARRDDTSLIRDQSDQQYGYVRKGRYTPDLDRYFLLSAAEQRYPGSPKTFYRAGARSFRRYPDFWFNHGYVELDWGVYPVHGNGVFRGPFVTSSDAPTTLVVGTTGDPATPYVDNKAMVAQLGNARLLTMKGDGHTAYGGNSRCIDSAVNAFFFRGALPPVGKTCRQHVAFAPPHRGAGGVASVRSPFVVAARVRASEAFRQAVRR